MTIAVNFDGVIHQYSRGWQDGTIYDPPMPGALDGLRRLQSTEPVFIFTSRSTEQVAYWLFERGDFNITWEPPGDHAVEFWNDKDRLYITNRKLPARIYLDDRAVRFTGWDQALADLLPTGTAEKGSPTDWQAIATAREQELKSAWEGRHAATQERDGAYRERAQLLAWLAAIHPAVRTLAPDTTEPGWQLLYLNPTTGGQMSWHIAPRDVELFDHVEYVPAGAGDQRALWDGHTTETKYERIVELTSFLADVAEATGEAPYSMPDDEPTDADSDVFALISEIAGRLTDATDEGEYHAVNLIGDLANGRTTVAEAREQLADITFRHV